MTETGKEIVRGVIDLGLMLQTGLLGFYYGLMYMGKGPWWMNMLGAGIFAMIVGIFCLQLLNRKWRRDEKAVRDTFLRDTDARAEIIANSIEKNVARVTRKVHSFPLFSFGSAQTAVHLSDVAAIESIDTLTDASIKYATRVYMKGGAILSMEGDASIMREIWLKYLVATGEG